MSHTVNAPATITIDNTPGATTTFDVTVRAPQPSPGEVTGSFVSEFDGVEASAPVTITLESADIVPTLESSISDPRLSVDVGPLVFVEGSAFDYRATVTITVV